jgi:hypothetical protein
VRLSENLLKIRWTGRVQIHNMWVFTNGTSWSIMTRVINVALGPLVCFFFIPVILFNREIFINLYLDTQSQLLLTRKNTMDAFFNGELENEVRERNLEDKVYLDDTTTREKLMQQIDIWRRAELYSHPPDECSPICTERGKSSAL